MDSSLFLYAVREQELGIGDLRLLHATQVAMLDGDSSARRTTHGLVSSLMEYLVHWTSRCLDTRHLYEMTRSPDPRDLVTCCVQLLTTFYGIPLGMVSVMLCISYARPLPDPEVAGSGVGHSLPHSYV